MCACQVTIERCFYVDMVNAASDSKQAVEESYLTALPSVPA